jgi:hypothetical protein
MSRAGTTLSVGMKLTRFRGARQAFNGGFSDAQDASASKPSSGAPKKEAHKATDKGSNRRPSRPEPRFRIHLSPARSQQRTMPCRPAHRTGDAMREPLLDGGRGQLAHRGLDPCRDMHCWPPAEHWISRTATATDLLHDELHVTAIAAGPCVPVTLEIGDQFGAEKTICLIACVGGAVASK